MPKTVKFISVLDRTKEPGSLGEPLFLDVVAALRDTDPAGEAAQDAVRRWHEFIEENFYPCPRSVLAGLGQMFTGDAAFAETLEGYGAGTSAFMTAAIAVYCRQ